MTQPYILFGMVVGLCVVFALMAATAEDYLAPHLEIVVPVLGMSESLAGVTVFAFGNGSSDLFSTLAAMASDQGSLVISELFGAAAFVTTVVLGLVAIVRYLEPKYTCYHYDSGIRLKVLDQRQSYYHVVVSSV